MSAPVFHPRPDDHGAPVRLKNPSSPTPLLAWSDPSTTACVVPEGEMPAAVNGIAIRRWSNAPTSDEAWEALAASQAIGEPPFEVPKGYKKAAGAVIRETDGRIWVVAPSNAFAGYQATFPKGTMDGKSAQATALVEVFEESGLQVRLIRHLIDVPRTQSYTRYYLAERVGGNPADMGWETQAVMLAPKFQLAVLLNNPNDTAIVNALMTLGETAIRR
ncbi:NUDIX hydrolase [Hydrogenophaga sp. T2]|uniref:NUDIX hydrolase n=1 Tax=Hydrogenophaga sp. T2 TaxID=3132823 RepID=UPI003CF3BBD8